MTETELESLNTYQLMRRALRITRKITKLTELTGISRSTLTLIARGQYKGSLSTKMRLEDFILEHEKRIGHGKKEESAEVLLDKSPEGHAPEVEHEFYGSP